MIVWLSCCLVWGCGGHSSSSGPEDAGPDATDVSADVLDEVSGNATDT